MSAIRPGTCAEPGPADAHCTEPPGHRYSCHDAGEDVSWNDRAGQGPHACDEPACDARSEDVPVFVPPGAVREFILAHPAVELAPKVVLEYPDGTWRFAHLCSRSARSLPPIVCAPLLQAGPGGHVVTVIDGRVNVTPSILCEDCGMHGFATDGRWNPC